MGKPIKRIIIHKPGGYAALQMETTPIEDPGTGEVQVAVKACGINFADIAVRLGLYAAARGQYPLCPGLEFSGVVRAVGRDVSTFGVGESSLWCDPFRGLCRGAQLPGGPFMAPARGLGFFQGRHLSRGLPHRLLRAS
ncbi:MAG: alcohol dehydrogenase catalytic domain-containing protein [Deltaproteobacteria bacterium]|nr:alcohol dehydrogenase catalytic domain-containing protein [Deltaproteobacteria bacterium]